MKKITKPLEQEEAVYYSDFSGKIFEGGFEPPVKLKLEFNYGSKYDGSKLELDLDDDDATIIIDFLKKHLNEESKEKLKLL